MSIATTDSLEMLLDGDRRLIAIIQPLIDRLNEDRALLAAYAELQSVAIEYTDKSPGCICFAFREQDNKVCWYCRFSGVLALIDAAQPLAAGA